MTQELITRPDTQVGDALPASAIKAQVQLIQEVMKSVMIPDTHYGIIPGTPKPSLYKPGAEKLCLTFRLDPEYDSTERFDGQHLFVKSKCTLYHSTTGRRLGSGEGSCSTREAKYAYRQGKRKCPKCGKDAIIKGKQEYGGGWLCFQKKDGCGSKWPDGAKEIEGQNTDRIQNEDLADQYNTVLKMANKRSLVAAVLNVTAASDLFTQDIEDMPDMAEKHEMKSTLMDHKRDASAKLADLRRDAVASSTAGKEEHGQGEVYDSPKDELNVPGTARTGDPTPPASSFFDQTSRMTDWRTAMSDESTVAGKQAVWDRIVKDEKLTSEERSELYGEYQKQVKKARGK